jgi:hypothetical protein
MRPIAFAALIAASLAVSGLATSGLAQTVASAHPALMVETADMTVRDGSDAGPIQPVAAGQAEDANSVADLPRIATHAPTPLGRPVPASQIGDSQ